MSSQTKVTDFFVSQKRSDKTLRSVGKHIKTGPRDDLLVTNTDDQLLAPKRTPKRKTSAADTKSVRSSKRNKTPKCEVTIEFKSNDPHIAGHKPVGHSDGTNATMNVSDVKQKLLKCSNLLDLKRQLSQINDCAAKVKQFKEMKVRTPTKKHIRTPTKSVRSPNKNSPIRSLISLASPLLPPIKSPVSFTPDKDSKSALTFRRKLFDVYEDDVLSPRKVDDKKGRAFERYSYLLDKPDDNRSNSSLVLPLKYKLLAETFRSMDTIVSMHYKRQEVCTFEKLKESVERMTNKMFDTKKLAQIQTVLSNAFKLKYELISSYLDNRKPYYQLIITPVYNTDIRTNSLHLLERSQLFVANLLDITKGHHKRYLNGLGLNVDDKELVRWHPKFKLDSVSDIEPNVNALPIEPKLGDKSAEHFLENTRQRLGISSTTATAELNDNDIISVNKTIGSNDSNQKITKGLLKGISMDLLNKIRAKEAANLAQEMTRKPEVENELRLLRSLPEFIRIIHTFFIGSKKLATPYDQLVDKLISSFNTSLSILRAREHVDYLCRFMPDWICLLDVKRGQYVKINKDMSISSLDTRINQMIQHLKK